jgi:hypothetical protein
MALELVKQTFADRLGESFTATPSLGGDPLPLELTGCDESPHAREDHPAFSLSFQAPGPGYLPQQIFTIEHADLGEFALFLVPLGPSERGMAYEAVVNN